MNRRPAQQKQSNPNSAEPAKTERVADEGVRHTVFIPDGVPRLVSQGVRIESLGREFKPPGADSAVAPAAAPVPVLFGSRFSMGPNLGTGTRPNFGAKNRSNSGPGGQGPTYPAIPSMGWKKPAVWEGLAAKEENGPDESDVLFVPPEVEAQGQQVMDRYDMSVGSMSLITTKPDKGGAIWRIDTNHGPRSLKLLHRAPERSLFSVGAQEYLVNQGARVPALVPTKDGQLAVEIEGKLWIVTDWIENLSQATKVDLQGAQALCYGLGEFHRLSRGYVPPQGAAKSTRLHRWPKVYQKVLSKMGWFRQVAYAYPEMPASSAVLSMVDIFEQQAKDAIARLAASPYAELTARGEEAWGFAHQDYGWSNGQLGPGGVWIIDLDGVAYDLPIRDLRKLITSTMDDFGVWDLTWIRGMLDAYNEACPIEPELLQVVLIDMSLPNEFYKHVKEIVMDPPLNLGTELELLLQRLVQVEVSKWQALRELGLDSPPEASTVKGKGGV